MYRKETKVKRQKVTQELWKKENEFMCFDIDTGSQLCRC